jgi:hypothetical protein
MPCNCNKPRAPIPLARKEEWGPLLWAFLHGTAERQIIHYKVELIWRRAIAGLSFVIPCIECRGHYTTYLAANPCTPPRDPAACKQYMRTWLHTFHNAVNVRLEKPTFPMESLEATYSGTNLGLIDAQLREIMSQYRMVDIVSIVKWGDFSSAMNYLRSG